MKTSIAFAIFFGLMGLAILYGFASASAECQERGGQLTKTTTMWKCMDEVE